MMLAAMNRAVWSSSPRLRVSVRCAVVIWWLAGWGVGPASADDVAAASKAFAEAQKEMFAGDPARAADLFELADSLAPSPVALRNAARARLAAGHNATAATHSLELLRRYPEDGGARAVAEEIVKRLGPTLGRVQVVCSQPCSLEVDGAPTAAERKEHAIFVSPGRRRIEAVFSDRLKAGETVEAEAGNHTYRLELDAPPQAAPARLDVRPSVARASGDGKKRLSRVWPIATGVLAVGLAGGAVYFGTATLSARDDVLAANERNDPEAARDAYDRGRDKQLATNIFIGAAGAAGIAAIALALFTDWSGRSAEPGRDVALRPVPGGANVVFSARF
jgi:hypothetical protein